MEASESTHAPDVTREGLTWINDTSPKYNVIIINGMALVNVIPKTERIKICNDFAQVFLDQLSNMAGDSNEVRLVFDIYINTSQRTNGQRGNLHVTYHVKDTTLIQNISLKNLSNVKTIVELTTHLTAKTTLKKMQRLSLHLQTLLFSLWWFKCIRAYHVT